MNFENVRYAIVEVALLRSFPSRMQPLHFVVTTERARGFTGGSFQSNTLISRLIKQQLATGHAVISIDLLVDVRRAAIKSMCVCVCVSGSIGRNAMQ